MTAFVEGMHGLGDTIYLRAFVKALLERDDVYLATPWPEIFADLPVRCVKKRTVMRTQVKNIAASSYTWHKEPASCRRLAAGYDLRRESIWEGFQRTLGVSPDGFDLPPANSRGACAVVRPVTVRREFPWTARNPDPAYVAMAAAALADETYVVSVADLQDGEEWLDGAAPPCHASLHGGVPLGALLGLVSNATALVGGVGWLLPAAIASGVPMLCIAGGQGGMNAPEKVGTAKNVTWAIPDNYDRGLEPQAACDKTISRFTEILTDWIHGLDLRRPAEQEPRLAA